MVCCLSIAGRSNGHESLSGESRWPTTTQLCVTGSRRISILFSRPRRKGNNVAARPSEPLSIVGETRISFSGALYKVKSAGSHLREVIDKAHGMFLLHNVCTPI